MAILRTIGRYLTAYLTQPSRSPFINTPTSEKAIIRVCRPGDVLLVEGRLRISSAIKYLTNSTWSHAALCIEAGSVALNTPTRFVEADASEGVRIVTSEQFSGLHARICRPVGLNGDDIRALVANATDRVGDEYDLANIVDLARYLLPTPPVPGRWRRRMLALGSGEPTKAICSSLIAQAFQAIQYPILPAVSEELIGTAQGNDIVQEILHIRHHSLFTPRDFDVSPYFEIIKPTLATGFDFHKLEWAEAAV